MSSEATGFLEVTLPKDKVVDFEDYFNDDMPNAFINVDLKMIASRQDGERKDYRRRQYELSCSHSLLGCFVEDREKDIKKICEELGVEELEISTANTYENFSEEITYKSGKCNYRGHSYGEEDTKFSIPQQSGMVAE